MIRYVSGLIDACLHRERDEYKEFIKPKLYELKRLDKKFYDIIERSVGSFNELSDDRRKSIVLEEIVRRKNLLLLNGLTHAINNLSESKKNIASDAFDNIEDIVTKHAGGKLEPARHDPDAKCDDPTKLMQHMLWMAQNGVHYVDGRTNKAMRWLGFCQGALWAAGHATIASFKDVNRGYKK